MKFLNRLWIHGPPVRSKRCSSLLSYSYPSRSFHHGSGTHFNEPDPFGFDQSKPHRPIESRQTHHHPSQSRPQTSQDLDPKQTSEPTPPSIGGEIFRRLNENRQQELRRLRQDEQAIRVDGEERASLDQLWKFSSQLKLQNHFGPLTPASSRVVRTVRIPPTSFLNRPVLASDVERSYRRLQTWLNAAGLRKEINLNRRYEKPFLKRRRLRSERHRRRFAIEVQRRVQIINVMRMKGM